MGLNAACAWEALNSSPSQNTTHTTSTCICIEVNFSATTCDFTSFLFVYCSGRCVTSKSRERLTRTVDLKLEVAYAGRMCCRTVVLMWAIIQMIVCHSEARNGCLKLEPPNPTHQCYVPVWSQHLYGAWLQPIQLIMRSVGSMNPLGPVLQQLPTVADEYHVDRLSKLTCFNACNREVSLCQSAHNRGCHLLVQTNTTRQSFLMYQKQRLWLRY